MMCENAMEKKLQSEMATDNEEWVPKRRKKPKRISRLASWTICFEELWPDIEKRILLNPEYGSIWQPLSLEAIISQLEVDGLWTNPRGGYEELRHALWAKGYDCVETTAGYRVRPRTECDEKKA